MEDLTHDLIVENWERIGEARWRIVSENKPVKRGLIDRLFRK